MATTMAQGAVAKYRLDRMSIRPHSTTRYAVVHPVGLTGAGNDHLTNSHFAEYVTLAHLTVRIVGLVCLLKKS